MLRENIQYTFAFPEWLHQRGFCHVGHDHQLKIINIDSMVDFLPKESVERKTMLSRHHALRYRAWSYKIPHHITHQGRVTHICVSKLTIIGSDNGLSPDRRQAIIRTNAGISLIRVFRETSSGIYTFSLRKMHLIMSSAKRLQCCLGISVLRGEKRSGVMEVYLMVSSTYYEMTIPNILRGLFTQYFKLSLIRWAKMYYMMLESMPLVCEHGLLVLNWEQPTVNHYPKVVFVCWYS